MAAERNRIKRNQKRTNDLRGSLGENHQGVYTVIKISKYF